MSVSENDPTRRARYPQLLKIADPPLLIGHRCNKCQRAAFPPDPFGCERCGAMPSDLAPLELSPTGVIHAVATVHRHHHPRPETPFTVATITLDEGATVKGVMTGDPETAQIGSRVHGVLELWEVADDGTEVVDLRFKVSN